MSIDYKELEKRVSDIETRAKDILEKRKALKLANEIRSNRENVYYNTKLNTKVNTIMEERNISKELLERRAVTLSGTGTTVTDSELVKLVKNTHKVLGDVKFYYGANGTVIPVQASLPSVPSSKAESDFTNAISNNGVTNTILENWIANHDNYVVTPVSIDYTNCSYQRKNGGRTDEVIITNFDIGEKEWDT